MEGEIVQKCAEGKQKLLRHSGRFELSRVRVTEGKITANQIQGKSTLVRVSEGSSYRESTVCSRNNDSFSSHSSYRFLNPNLLS